MLRISNIGALLLVALGGAGGCTPDPLILHPDMGIEDPQIDPRTIFQSQALPAMATCAPCHKQAQAGLAPFLTDGGEYAAITTYGSGKFLTQSPDQSLLLTKGNHAGPALNVDQADRVLSWLTVEAGARSKLTATTSVTPSVALRQGDFFISLEKLVGDPLARVTFHVEPGTSGNVRLQNLKLTAGKAGAIRVVHPLLMIFSVGTAFKSDESLSNIDTKVPAGATVSLGPGTLILTNVPLSARLAMAFQTIALVDPAPGGVQCKAYPAFKSGVLPLLRSPCATVCHSPTGADPRSPQATNAFDMSAAAAADDATLQALCVRTLGRSNVDQPGKSVLVLQPAPASAGGTLNHPYKWGSDAVSKSFIDAVTQWLNGEK